MASQHNQQRVAALAASTLPGAAAAVQAVAPGVPAPGQDSVTQAQEAPLPHHSAVLRSLEWGESPEKTIDPIGKFYPVGCFE